MVGVGRKGTAPRHRGGVFPSARWLTLRGVHHAEEAGTCGRTLRYLRSMRLIRRGVRWIEDQMAEYGEWNRKKAVLSDVTAKAEYGVNREFVVKGIEAGRLEYREGVMWGNPYLRILRSQLEGYIIEELGEDYLVRVKAETELRRTKKEISDLKKKLNVLQERKADLEQSLKK